ncbi:O-antigen ligase family protein [Pedosphaera parvula]|uniref:O-antigen polymerase n=1 Tax=Pedosphaera parvula (strain Ellin514) TaxID=320771 RepID=B9XBG9_PEDPL|nr:O-antigen ligase family protein [Pedosphaera parvula]EEF62854.1 O-antigen polymerase [Pedosphaera parvula Ellin514]
MDREQIDSWCEKGILALVIGILVFSALAFGAVGQWEFLVVQGLTVGALLLWGIRLWLIPRPKILWTPVCWGVVAFVAYAIVRYLQADIEYVARQELIRILVYAFLFLIVLNNLHRQELTQIFALAVIFLGMLISFYAIYQYVAKSNKVWTAVSPYTGRAGGTFIYPNNFAGYLEMLLPVGLCYVLAGRFSHVMKIALGYACVAMLAGIGVTMSRGGWLVAGVTLAALCGVLLTQRNFRIQALLLLALLLIGGMVMAPRLRSMNARFANTFSSGRADDLRFSIWKPAYRMWQDHFWLGVGPDHFDYVFRIYRPEDVQLRPGRAHNDYLNTLADWGLVGTIIVLAAWILLYAGVWKSWRAVRGVQDDFSRKKSNKYAFVMGASLGLFAVLLHATVDFNLHTPAVAILAISLMAILSSHLRFATERYWFGIGRWMKIIGTASLVVSGAYLTYEAGRSARECYWLRQADRLPEYTYAKIAALEKVHQVEPMNFETTYAIGECYWIKSRQGGDDYEALAKKAMEWYERGMKLDPFYGYNWVRTGMCLDWIGQHEESWSYYQHGNELDPNGYITTANTGWHFLQIGDYAAARTWFARSQRLERENNAEASFWLPIIKRKMLEAAVAK